MDFTQFDFIILNGALARAVEKGAWPREYYEEMHKLIYYAQKCAVLQKRNESIDRNDTLNPHVFTKKDGPFR